MCGLVLHWYFSNNSYLVTDKLNRIELPSCFAEKIRIVCLEVTNNYTWCKMNTVINQHTFAPKFVHMNIFLFFQLPFYLFVVAITSAHWSFRCPVYSNSSIYLLFSFRIFVSCAIFASLSIELLWRFLRTFHYSIIFSNLE